MLDNLEKVFAIMGVLLAAFQVWLALQEFRANKPSFDLGDSEWRVLRALLNEDSGRQLNIYSSSESYKKAIENLTNEKFIRFEFNKYYLTDKGKKALKEHLRKFIKTKLD